MQKEELFQEELRFDEMSNTLIYRS